MEKVKETLLKNALEMLHDYIKLYLLSSGEPGSSPNLVLQSVLVKASLYKYEEFTNALSIVDLKTILDNCVGFFHTHNVRE
jgi:hypothetical protein